MAKTYSAFPWVVRASAVTPRKQQISTVVTPHSEILSSAKVVLFDATKHVDCSHKRAQQINVEIDFKKSRFSRWVSLLSELMLIVTTPSVFQLHKTIETTYVCRNESLTRLVFLGGMMTEEAWSSTNTYVSTVYELACKSSRRVLWPRKLRLFSARQHNSLWGVKTVDICCFRGVTALALTTDGKALGFATNICSVWFVGDFKALTRGERDIEANSYAES
jgi:hypothetical protein